VRHQEIEYQRFAQTAMSRYKTMQMKISVTAIKTPYLSLVKDLSEFLYARLRNVPLDDRILAITLKCLVGGARRVSKSETSRHELVKKEADVYLGVGGMGTDLTIKHGLLIPSAGIDESNARTSLFSTLAIRMRVRKKFGGIYALSLALKQFGVILTIRTRRRFAGGVNGIGLSHWGFRRPSLTSAKKICSAGRYNTLHQHTGCVSGNGGFCNG